VNQVALAGVLEILKHLHGLGVNGVALNTPQVLWLLDDYFAYVSSTKRCLTRAMVNDYLRQRDGLRRSCSSYMRNQFAEDAVHHLSLSVS